MKYPPNYDSYTLNEKIIYAKGWNAAIKEASWLALNHSRWIGSSNYANIIDNKEISSKISKLDVSMSATDD
jgi:hypothetical protein